MPISGKKNYVCFNWLPATKFLIVFYFCMDFFINILGVLTAVTIFRGRGLHFVSYEGGHDFAAFCWNIEPLPLLKFLKLSALKIIDIYWCLTPGPRQLQILEDQQQGERMGGWSILVPSPPVTPPGLVLCLPSTMRTASSLVSGLYQPRATESESYQVIIRERSSISHITPTAFLQQNQHRYRPP